MIGSRVVVTPPKKAHPSWRFWCKYQHFYQKFVGTTQTILANGQRQDTLPDSTKTMTTLAYWYQLEPATKLIVQDPFFINVKNGFVSYFNNSWLQPACSCSVNNLLIKGCQCGGL